MAVVVATPQSVDHNAPGGVRGVDKLAVSQIQSDVRDAVAVAAEEYQITGQKLIHSHMHTVVILLLRAAVALEKKDLDRCDDLLQGVQNKDNARWALLKGEVLFEKGDYSRAAQWYQKAEKDFPEKAYPRLESCYRELGDFKLAYEYACKQR